MTRNKVRMEGVISSTMEIARQVQRLFIKHKQAWKEKTKRQTRDPTWHPPPIEWVKLNFDAALENELARWHW